MSDSNIIKGLKKGVYLFGTTNSMRYEPLQSKNLAEIQQKVRDSRVEKLLVPVNRAGKRHFVGTLVGLGRTAVGIVALAVALATAPILLCFKRSYTGKMVGFGLAWTLLGTAEMIPLLGKLAHYLAKPSGERTFELSSEKEREVVLGNRLVDGIVNSKNMYEFEA